MKQNLYIVLKKTLIIITLFLIVVHNALSRHETDHIINNFQHGQTLNGEIPEFRIAFSSNPAYSSKHYLPSDNELDFFNNHDFSPNVDYYESYYGMIGISFPLAEKMDLGVDFSIGTGIGARLFTKYQLSENNDKLSYSLLTGISYTHEQDLFNKYSITFPPYNYYDYEISMITGELDFPMSYQLSEIFKVLFGAKLYVYNYVMDAEANIAIVGNNLQVINTETIKQMEVFTLFSPAINLGFMTPFIGFEGTLLYVNQNLRFYIGTGINFLLSQPENK